MQRFDYVRPSTLAETIGLLASGGHGMASGSRILAGGTDLLPLMKSQLIAPERLIDIKRLNELGDGIALNESGGITIGALCTLDQIERSELIRSHALALAEAAEVAASPQLRNMATIGGNILQRPRCWYFRDPEIDCWLKGGDSCPAVSGENQHHAIFEQSPCQAVHPSDLATALVALNASVHISGAGAQRTVAISDFFAAPDVDRRTEHTLQADEVITAVSLPIVTGAGRSTYLKAMERKTWSFALVSVAAHIELADGLIAGASIVLGGVANVPYRCSAAESLLTGAKPGQMLFENAARAVVEAAVPLTKNGFKVPLAKALLIRAFTSLCEQTSLAH